MAVERRKTNCDLFDSLPFLITFTLVLCTESALSAALSVRNECAVYILVYVSFIFHVRHPSFCPIL